MFKILLPSLSWHLVEQCQPPMSENSCLCVNCVRRYFSFPSQKLEPAAYMPSYFDFCSLTQECSLGPEKSRVSEKSCLTLLEAFSLILASSLMSTPRTNERAAQPNSLMVTCYLGHVVLPVLTSV